VRFADERRQKGKRGGIRVIYYRWFDGAQFWLFTLYGKDVQDDLSAAQKKVLKSLLALGCQREEEIMKRNVFAELVGGFDALAGVRTGKVTLRSHKVEMNKLPAVTAGELVEIREHLHLSRPVFAMYLRTNARTLENWEQGRAKPNAQATTLIRLVQKYPETVGRLAALV
jgi:putative transcriptional regulator